MNQVAAETDSETCLETVYRPEISEWPDIIRTQSASSLSPSLFSNEEKLSFRERMLRAAFDYTRALDDLVGLTGLAEAQPEMPIIATGHQPLIYHMGVLEKLRAMSELKKHMPVTTLQVLIDIDEGSFADVLYPEMKDEEPTLESFSLSECHGLAFLQPGMNVERIDSLLEKMKPGLTGLSVDSETIARMEKALTLYKKFHYLPLRDLNTLVRRSLSFHTQLEIPLSHLMADEVLQKFFVDLVSDFESFHSRYNEILEKHRLERKIKNAANPFPNLKKRGDFYELPLWLFDKKQDRRSPLYVRAEGSQVFFSDGSEDTGSCVLKDLPAYISETFTIYPRAVFISMILRRLVSDLFIHGTGGETYDRFTDTLLKEHFKVEPGEYAIVSATHTLFPEEVKAIQHQQVQFERIHEATSKPEKFFSGGIFSPQGEEKLRSLVDQKQGYIEELRGAGGNAELIGIVKKKLNDLQILVKETVVEELTPATIFSKQAAEVYACRLFPYFLFSQIT